MNPINLEKCLTLLKQNQEQLLKLKELDPITYNSLISSNQECIRLIEKNDWTRKSRRDN